MLALVAACSAKKFGPPLAPYKGVRSVVLDAGTDDLAKAHMAAVGTFYERAIGPFLATSDKGAISAYVGGAKSGATTRPVVAMALNANGQAVEQARVVGEAPLDTSTLVVRRVDGGFLLAWTSLTDRGESLTVVGVGEKGEPRGTAVELARTPDHMVWVEIVPTSHGAVCIWAEEPPNGGANVLTQALDASGRPRGVPSRSLRGASSWQAVPAGDGVALGVVQGGALSLAHLDAEARLVGEPSRCRRPSARTWTSSKRATRSSSRGPTERGSIPSSSSPASIRRTRSSHPHDALPDAGSSALVAVASGPSGALVIWEPAHKRERVVRRVHLGVIKDPAASLQSTTVLDLAGGFALEARSRGDGWTVLGGARTCPVEAPTDCGAPAPTSCA